MPFPISMNNFNRQSLKHHKEQAQKALNFLLAYEHSQAIESLENMIYPTFRIKPSQDKKNHSFIDF